MSSVPRLPSQAILCLGVSTTPAGEDAARLSRMLKHLEEEGFEQVLASGPGPSNPFVGISLDSLRIKWIPVPEDVGSLAALRNLSGIADDFLLLTKAVQPDLPFGRLLEHRRRSGAVGTLAISVQSIPIPFDLVRTNPEGMVTGYKSRPSLQNSVFLGAAAFQREILDWIAGDESLELGELVGLLIAGNRRIDTFAV